MDDRQEEQELTPDEAFSRRTGMCRRHMEIFNEKGVCDTCVEELLELFLEHLEANMTTEERIEHEANTAELLRRLDDARWYGASEDEQRAVSDAFFQELRQRDGQADDDARRLLGGL